MLRIELLQFLLLLYISPVSSLNSVYHTDIIIANKQSGQAEVYNLTINCQPNNWCSAEPIISANLWWKSKSVGRIGDAKRIIYNGQDAVLIQVGNCAIVLNATRSNHHILFYKCLDAWGRDTVNIHAVEALPDGNVIILDSAAVGYGYLLRKGTYADLFERYGTSACRIPNMQIKFGHGLVWDRKRKLLYVLEYLKLHAYTYHSRPSDADISEYFTLQYTEDFTHLYQSNNKTESACSQDGGHDLYPASPTSVFLTTGERVFIYRPSEPHKFAYHRRFFYMLSKNGLANESDPNVIKFKGGIKAISKDMDAGLTLAKSAPWFGKCEIANTCEGSKNYHYSGGNGFVWYLPNSQCGTPNFDVAERGSDECNIRFGPDLKIDAYKARIYRIPTFSYDPTGVKLNRYTYQP